MLSNFFSALLLIIPVTEVEEKQNLGNSTVWVVEEDGYSFEKPDDVLAVFAEGAYEGPRKKKGANLGFQNHAAWFLARVKNTKEIQEHIVSFQAASLDDIQIWVFRSDRLDSYQTQGDNYSVERRFYPERMANFKVDIEKGENIFLLYRIKSSSPTTGILEIQTTRSYTIDAMIDNALLWCIYGMIGIMLVYHIFLAVSLKSSLYWLYSAYIFSALIAQMNTQGHFFQYFTGNFPESSSPLMLIYNINILLLFAFTAKFLELSKFSPRGLRAIQVAAAYLFFGIAVFFVKGPTTYNKLFMPIAFLLPIIIMTVAFIAMYKGHRAARYFTLAFAVSLGATMVFVAKIFALLPLNNIVQFSMPIGTACQLTLMALALGDRMRIIEEEARKAKEKQLEEEAAHREEISKLNESLEIRVDEQTRDIKSMLVSTKIGLLSITVDFSLHKDYSTHLETIVGEENLAGRSFLELILDKSDIGPDEKDKITTAIEYTIGEDEMFFDVNSDCFPHEVKANLDGGEKHLDLDWSPVLDKEECIERILVSVKDITETIALRQQAEDGKRSLRYLGEIIEVGPEHFETFETSAAKTFTEINSILQRNQDAQILNDEDARQIFIGLHTIKGAARFYKFSDFTDAIHLAEEIVAAKSSIAEKAYNDLVEKMDEIITVNNFYKKALEPLLKITERQNSGLSNLDKHDINKLVHEMAETANKLAQDIGKGGCNFTSDIPNGTVLSPDFHEALSKTFIHLLRNSIDHGLEKPEEREASGKPVEGSLRVFMDGQGRLCFEDDGKGLNLKAIKMKADKLGIDIQNMNGNLAELIFNSGFSTKDEADEVSGRGVGMDAVREFMRQAGSDISIVPKGDTADDFMQVYFAITMPRSALNAA